VKASIKTPLYLIIQKNYTFKKDEEKAKSVKEEFHLFRE